MRMIAKEIMLNLVLFTILVLLYRWLGILPVLAVAAITGYLNAWVLRKINRQTCYHCRNRPFDVTPEHKGYWLRMEDIYDPRVVFLPQVTCYESFDQFKERWKDEIAFFLPSEKSKCLIGYKRGR